MKTGLMGITIIGLTEIIIGAVSIAGVIFGAWIMTANAPHGNPSGALIFIIPAFFLFILSATFLAVGICVLKRKRFARKIQIILTLPLLFVIPGVLHLLYILVLLIMDVVPPLKPKDLHIPFIVIGLITGILNIYYFTRPKVKEQFQ